MRRSARTIGLLVVVAVAYFTGGLTTARAQVMHLWTSTLSGHFASPFSTPTSSGTGTAFKFAATTTTGAPVTWNACAPVNLVVNLTGAPAGALEDLKGAVADIAQASGIKLTLVGTTNLPLAAGWGTHAEPGYKGWAPVLIGWAPPSSGLIAPAVGGRTTTVRSGDQYVSAMVVFNSELDAHRAAGSGAPETRGALYRHELGHVVGLDHVSDTSELMNPSAAFGGAIAAGDRAGLRAVGAQPCKSAPAPSW